ncbi:MAG: AAA family ATPase, partial [Clostridia bacterium]
LRDKTTHTNDIGNAAYLYPHDHKNNYVIQQYLPDDIKNKKYYSFGNNKNEKSAEDYWNKIK